MTHSTYAKPLPRITPLNQGFWEYARKGHLAVQICDKCGDCHFPASPACPSCLSSEQFWRPVSGRGELLSWGVFHRAYWDGFRNDLPYTVCIVRLEEGPMLASNLVGAKEGTFAVGDPVEVLFDEVTDEVTLPKFRIARR